MKGATYKIIHYIQKSLYEGKKQDTDEYYIYTRKELAEGANVSLTSVNTCKYEVVEHFKEGYDLFKWAEYKEYLGEKLFLNVDYAHGELRFQRNPITLREELKHLWALRPLYEYFVYDVFDDKHRRKE